MNTHAAAPAYSLLPATAPPAPHAVSSTA